MPATFSRQRLLIALIAVALVTFACGGDDKQSSPRPVAPAVTTSAGLKVHPAGTRTGVQQVDAVIAAAETGDAQKIAAQIHFYVLPCEHLAMASIPCRLGQPVGSVSEVFGLGLCEGQFLLKGDANIPRLVAETLALARPPGGPQSSMPTLDPRVYAVIKRGLFPSEPRIPGDHVIVFASGHAFSVDGTGITYISLSCGLPTDPAGYVSGGMRYPGQTLVLAPP